MARMKKVLDQIEDAMSDADRDELLKEARMRTVHLFKRDNLVMALASNPKVMTGDGADVPKIVRLADQILREMAEASGEPT